MKNFLLAALLLLPFGSLQAGAIYDWAGVYPFVESIEQSCEDAAPPCDPSVKITLKLSNSYSPGTATRDFGHFVSFSFEDALGNSYILYPEDIIDPGISGPDDPYEDFRFRFDPASNRLQLCCDISTDTWSIRENYGPQAQEYSTRFLYAGTVFDVVGGDITLRSFSVPEPSPILIMGVAFLFAAILRRRRTVS